MQTNAAAAALPGHASGGIFNKPHVAVIAEHSPRIPEAAIPVENTARSYDLWRRVGEMTGFVNQATPEPAGRMVETANKMAAPGPIGRMVETVKQVGGGIQNFINNVTNVTEGTTPALAAAGGPTVAPVSLNLAGLSGLLRKQGGGGATINFSPNVTVNASGTQQDGAELGREAMRSMRGEFEKIVRDTLKRDIRDHNRASYADDHRSYP